MANTGSTLFAKAGYIWVQQDNVVFFIRTYKEILSLLQKRHNFSNEKYWYFFLFLHKNVCCGYTLVVPRQGISNVYQ